MLRIGDDEEKNTKLTYSDEWWLRILTERYMVNSTLKTNFNMEKMLNKDEFSKVESPSKESAQDVK